MKQETELQHWLQAAILSLALIGATGTALANADLVINSFDSGTAGTQPSGCGDWYANGSATWDATGNPDGSIYITANFAGCCDTPMVEFVCLPGENLWWNQPTAINLTEYKSLQFDIKWDTSSTVTIDQFNDLSAWGPTDFLQSWAPVGYLSGSTPGLEIDVCNNGDGTLTFLAYTNIPAAAASGWTHVIIPISPIMSGVDKSPGIMFKKWIKQSWGIGSTVTAKFWVDNVMLEGIPVPLANPKLDPPKPVASTGLWLGVSSGHGGTREGVHTMATVPWYNVATADNPVSYAMTIADFPSGNAMPGVQAHLFLCNDPISGTGAPEYNSTNAIFLSIQSQGAHAAWVQLMFKTNAPVGWGGQIFGSNTLATLYVPDMRGEWSLTFSNNTDAWLRGPGAVTNFVFPAEAAPYFDQAWATFGLQPDNDTYTDAAATLSHVKITGTGGGLFDDTFSTLPLDTSLWGVTGPQYAVEVIPTGSAYWVTWALPAASGFTLRTLDNIATPVASWTDLSGVQSWSYGGRQRTLVPLTSLANTNQSFFIGYHP